MIGWFSLNVPAALCIYWVANNVITTATTLIVKNNLKAEPVAAGGAATIEAPASTESSIFAPPPLRDTPAGFATSDFAADGMKPITAVDAEIVEDAIGTPAASGEGI